MSKAVFLDRDGTLCEDGGYLHKVKDLKVLPGVSKALVRLQKAGYLLVEITNQSGVGRGMYREVDFDKFQDALERALGVDRDRFLVFPCFHKPEDMCECRKPEPGLYEQVESCLSNLNYLESWSIGDRAADLEAAKAHCPSIRTIRLPKDAGTSQEKTLPASRWDDYFFDNMEEAVNFILGEELVEDGDEEWEDE